MFIIDLLVVELSPTNIITTNMVSVKQMLLLQADQFNTNTLRIHYYILFYQLKKQLLSSISLCTLSVVVGNKNCWTVTVFNRWWK